MACGNVQNIRINPANVSWQIEEQWDITAVADVSSSLNDDYFFINDGADLPFYVWFNIGAAGTDPLLAGKTGIEVAAAVNASATVIAAAVAAAVDAETEFKAVSDGAVITITATVAGQSTDWADSIGGTATGFSFVQCQDGGYLELGLLDGDTEITFEESQLDITAQQTGTTILASLRQGLINGVSLVMKEAADLSLIKEVILGTAGGSYTPSGGTEVFGWGTASLGKNTIVKSRRLVLHPVSKADADLSEDLCFWKSYALPESLTLSGENPEVLALSFKVYKDDAKPVAVNQFIFGDWSQSEFIP